RITPWYHLIFFSFTIKRDLLISKNVYLQYNCVSLHQPLTFYNQFKLLLVFFIDYFVVFLFAVVFLVLSSALSNLTTTSFATCKARNLTSLVTSCSTGVPFFI